MKKLLIGKDVRVVHQNDPLRIIIKDAFIMNIISDPGENRLMTLVCDKENGSMVYTGMDLLRFKDTKNLQNLIIEEAKKLPDDIEIKELDSRFRFMDFSGEGLIGLVKEEEEEEETWSDRFSRSRPAIDRPEEEIPF